MVRTSVTDLAIAGQALEAAVDAARMSVTFGDFVCAAHRR